MAETVDCNALVDKCAVAVAVVAVAADQLDYPLADCYSYYFLNYYSSSIFV